MMIQHNESQTYCKRCGTCCKKGGPVLHVQDRKLLVSGRLLPRDLVVFRKNELAFDPVKDMLVPIDEELIKIRGKDGSMVGECKFYNEDTSSCSIYDFRPLECRLLKCWDTREIEEVLMKGLLTRADLVPKTSVLWQIISSYERVFDLSLIRNTMAALADEYRLESFIQDLYEKDERFRMRLEEEFGLDSGELFFFLGRPIKDILSPILQ